jgi:deazaflavin-dependent oxidoreductase (nitroreductase family)
VPSDRNFRIFNGIHRTVFDLTKGRLGGRMAGMPVVKLTTTGRTTGRRRDTMLTSPVQDGDRVVIVASKGGDPRHPTWYLNLRENPEVTVTTQGRKRAMTAHTAAPDEKAELWPRIVESFKGYGDYQQRTDRDIPVVVLRPSD